ncbi:MAG: Ig-like domain-containing protein [Saprospiraceae bacterium]|nr:Ig-like domain-containing protein [Saprospiraceae bacterium]
MKKYLNLLLTLTILGGLFIACKKDNLAANEKYVLIIENGAVSITPDGSTTYSAILIDIDGNITQPESVTWTSSSSDIATISTTGQVAIQSVGITTITASVTIDGVTLTSSAPLNIANAGVFAVAPGAILVDTEFPDIPLAPFYVGTGTPSYSYTSSNTSIATVSSTGVVNFVGAGECFITVTANGLDGDPSVIVPIVVLGAPQVALPVTRVVVNPNSTAIFKSETATFSAKAYNSSGEEVSSSFAWTVEDPTIVTVDGSGNITPVGYGSTFVRATAEGITGEAEIIVTPERVLVLDPYYTSITEGSSKTFQATKYQVLRDASTGELYASTPTTVNAADLTWEIPTYGIDEFDIATVDNSGTVTIKNNALGGLSTVLIAYDPNDADMAEGASMIEVAIGTLGGCDCGTQNASAADIVISNGTTLNLGLGQQHQIQAQVVDANGDPVSGAGVTYCSDNIQIADADFSGNINVVSLTGGTANITVCHGNISKIVTVNVQ